MRPSHAGTIRRLLALLVFAGMIPWFQNCSSSHVGESLLTSQKLETFAQLKAQIFDPYCMMCHMSAPVDFSSYDKLMAGSSIVPGNPAASALYLRVQNGSMPQGMHPLSAVEVAAIADWIQRGAPSGVAVTAVPQAPAAPDTLVAQALAMDQIRVTWADRSSDETGFILERASAAAGPFVFLQTLPANATSFTHTGLAAATTQYYRVKSTNAIGDSAYSNVGYATTQTAPAALPAAPSSLNATAVSATQVNLAWTDNANNESGFRIERAATGGSFAFLANVLANITSYQDTGVSASSSYQYRVLAYSSAGSSAFSSVAQVTTSASPPMAPTMLSASLISQTRIDLRWLDVANNETGYKVERATASNGPFTVIATLSANTTAYSDSAVTGGPPYYYRVYAYGAGGNSLSATVTVQSGGN